MDIPSFLSHLPVYGGLPVPFTQVFVDGVPDFRAINPEKTRDCILLMLCGVCGLKLGETCWFIGGPISKGSHVFVDAWMHENCARFSSRACPFVSGNRMEYATRPVPNEMWVEYAVAAARPSHVYLMKAETKECLPVQVGASLGIHTGRWLVTEEVKSGG